MGDHFIEIKCLAYISWPKLVKEKNIGAVRLKRKQDIVRSSKKSA